ncbi:MAG: UDP-N-acetylmuramate--L-alanine ligase [Saprospiraceae bacterium]|nr:UDP-N-acetylmuramate--L-alanine ligase [Saprospiraceae bacterium]
MKNYKHIFFLGIGGIGMSALARYFHKRNYVISGYDRTESETTTDLEKLGIKIIYKDSIELISKAIDFVIWTPAIPKESLLYNYFIQSGIEMNKRSEILGKITAQHNNIAVAGTHGKTSTSILLTHLLAHSNFSITAFLGGVSSNYNSNYVDTGGQWMIEEADEFDRSFLKLRPDVAIIGSLDADHLDIYSTRDEMVKSYIEFASLVDDGLVLMSDVINETDLQTFRSSISTNTKLLTYGMKDADVMCSINQIHNSWTNFTYVDEKDRIIEELNIRFPGRHNIYNATAAIRVALELGLTEEQVREGLVSFKGIQRRFEWIHEKNQVLIDDYAHHPEELKAAIEALRSCYPNRKITGVFQPHLFSRTRDFASEFGNVLDLLDETILVELYPAREKPIEGISSLTILDKMKSKNKSFVTKNQLVDSLRSRSLDVVALLGAGDLSNLRNDIKKILS